LLHNSLGTRRLFPRKWPWWKETKEGIGCPGIAPDSVLRHYGIQHRMSKQRENTMKEPGMEADLSERLIAAAAAGKEDEVADLLARGANPNGTNKEGTQTPLLVTVKTPHVMIAHRLLAAGAAIGLANVDGVTPLHWAAARKQPAMARLLLDQGASVHVRERDGWTPLHWAAFRGATELAGWFLASGGDPNEPDIDGWTSLHLAAQQGHAGTVEFLMRHGADPSREDGAGRTAVALAAGRGHQDVVVALTRTRHDVP
jgi:ankyrin repeat protein